MLIFHWILHKLCIAFLKKTTEMANLGEYRGEVKIETLKFLRLKEG